MKLPLSILRELKSSIVDYPLMIPIVDSINQAGGRALLVGGAVRDLFLRRPIKDSDIEVHGLKLDQIQKILERFGHVSLVGKSFGVLRLNGLDVDWSVPRRDSSGRKPSVVIDPLMPLQDAFRRRDLTINAMGIDLKSYELLDPFGGLNDLKKGILRATDPELFVEDPLRFFRVMQFVGRFEMKPDRQLNQICKKMDLSTISRERIEDEFNKLFLKSKRPSLGINWLRIIGRLKEIMPELNETIGIEQDAKWHPEGDVYIHTLEALDAVANMTIKDSKQKLLFMWAALCHDLGKLKTTHDWGGGRISAYGHERAGIPLAKKLLKRFTQNKELIANVCSLVEHHMQPGQFIKNKAKSAAYKRLALKLAPNITLEMLAQFACADKLARNPAGEPYLLQSVIGKKLCKDEFAFMKKAKNLNVLREVEGPILQGRDLKGLVEPGPQMGKLLKKAYEIQLEEGINDKKELEKRILG